MPITELQRYRRQKHIGASDMPAIMGLSPWRTPYDVWLEKTGQVEPQYESEAMGIGNMLEDGLLDWASARLEMPITKNQYRVHENTILSASHDALVNGSPIGLEAKTSGRNDDWGDDGTDDVPAHVIIQCHQQMLVSGLELVFVPALLGGGFGLSRRLYRIVRDNDICEVIEREGIRFWREHVIPRVAPDGAPTLEVARRIIRTPNKITQIDPEIIAEWETAKANAALYEKVAKARQAEILAMLGDAEAAEYDGGMLTYYEQTRQAYQVQESKYRVMRIKKNK